MSATRRCGSRLRPVLDGDGFSLVELLVALALSALLASMVSAYVLRPSGTEARTTASEIVTMLRRARMSAINTQRPTDFVVDMQARTLRTNTASRVRSFPRTLSLMMVTGTTLRAAQTGRVRYFPDGSSSGGRITVTSEIESLDIDVDWLSGTISVTRREAMSGA